MAEFPGSVIGYGSSEFHKVGELCVSELVDPISDSTTSFDVQDAARFSSWPVDNFAVRVEEELIFVSSRSGDTLTIGERGFGGTTQEDHPSEAQVRVVTSASFVGQLASEVIAVEGELDEATQDLDLGGNRVTNLGSPSNASDAATKSYVDNLAGGDDLGDHTATQDLDMASNRVINVAAPSSDTDAATKKYVDDNVSGSSETVTLVEQSSDPTAPSGDDWLLYTKSDGLYYVDSNDEVTGPLKSIDQVDRLSEYGSVHAQDDNLIVWDSDNSEAKKVSPEKMKAGKLEKRTSDPVAPDVGRIWFREDLD